MTTIAVLVVSLPDRHGLLTEALDSVAAQTRPPDDVLVGIDPYRYGEVANMNRLIDATDCEWLAFLHDDDLHHPDHLATAEKHFDEADVVVSRFELVGRPANSMERWHDDFEDLRFTNWFAPSGVVVRRSTFGHWVDANERFRWIDWVNLNRLLDAGARFVDTQQATWSYRFGPWSNGSWRG